MLYVCVCIYIYTYLNRSIVQIIAQNDQKDMKVKTVKGNRNNLHQFATKLSRLNPPPLASLNFTAGSWAFYCSILLNVAPDCARGVVQNWQTQHFGLAWLWWVVWRVVWWVVLCLGFEPQCVLSVSRFRTSASRFALGIASLDSSHVDHRLTGEQTKLLGFSLPTRSHP